MLVGTVRAVVRRPETEQEGLHAEPVLEHADGADGGAGAQQHRLAPEAGDARFPDGREGLAAGPQGESAGAGTHGYPDVHAGLPGLRGHPPPQPLDDGFGRDAGWQP